MALDPAARFPIRVAALLVAHGSLPATAGCSAAEPGPADRPGVDLRADADRDGRVDGRGATDEADEDRWSPSRGAVVLANVDDDERVCPRVGDAGQPLSDLELAACHDAADEIVNGPEDLRDLAPLELVPWAEAPADAILRFEVTRTDSGGGARLFRDAAGAWLALSDGEPLGVEHLRAGATLRLEATAPPGPSSDEAAYVDVTASAISGSREWSDTVRLRVAPVVTQHDLAGARQVIVSRVESLDGYEEFRSDLAGAAASAGVEAEVTPWPLPALDPWMQDLFEFGWMSVPSKDGAHSILVALRSANVTRASPPGDVTPSSPRHEGARAVFDFRGPDVGVIQVFDPEHPVYLDSLNSTGNFERVPPYSSPRGAYPLGRPVWGATPTSYPDRAFTTFLRAQGAGDPLELDTSWLRVGHVDEMIAFVPAANARGWALLIASPRRARAILEELEAQGLGGTPMFSGKAAGASGVTPSAETTVQGALDDEDVMAASLRAAAELDTVLARLVDELALGPDEIAEAPVLFAESLARAVAYTPSLVNGTSLPPALFLAPRPHGPVVSGIDQLEASFAESLAPLGLTVRYVEDWELFHVNGGEVHCASNVLRGPSTAPWWESVP